MKNTFSMQYSGFHPSPWTESYLQTKISRMQDLAPYGAVVKAHFRRKGPMFSGFVHITSSAGSFFAKASGRKIKEVCNQLTDQIMGQLDKWKDTRFDRESIRHIYDKDLEQTSA
jgi:hypothetical protein